MKTRSAKNKGKALQNLVRDHILATFPLLPWDVISTPCGVQGVDIQLSTDARRHFDFNIECKNVEKLNLWAAWEQASGREGSCPMLVVKRNRQDPLVILDLNDFFKLYVNLKK